MLLLPLPLAARLLSNMSAILLRNWQLNRFSPSQSLALLLILLSYSCWLCRKLALKWARVDCSFVNVSTNVQVQVQRKSHRNRQKARETNEGAKEVETRRRTRGDNKNSQLTRSLALFLPIRSLLLKLQIQFQFNSSRNVEQIR